MGRAGASVTIQGLLDISNIRTNAALALRVLNGLHMPNLTQNIDNSLGELENQMRIYENYRDRMAAGFVLNHGELDGYIHSMNEINRLLREIAGGFDDLSTHQFTLQEISGFDTQAQQILNNILNIRTAISNTSTDFSLMLGIDGANLSIENLISHLRSPAARTHITDSLTQIFAGNLEPREVVDLINSIIAAYLNALNVVNGGGQVRSGYGRGLNAALILQEISSLTSIGLSAKGFFNISDVDIDATPLVTRISNSVEQAFRNSRGSSPQIQQAERDWLLRLLDPTDAYDFTAFSHDMQTYINRASSTNVRNMHQAFQDRALVLWETLLNQFGSFSGANANYLREATNLRNELLAGLQRTDYWHLVVLGLGSSFSATNINNENVVRSLNLLMQAFNRNADLLGLRVANFFSLNSALNLLRRTATSAFLTIKKLDAAMTETAVVTDFTVSDMWSLLDQYTQLANELGATTLGAYETMTLFYQLGLNTDLTFAVGTEAMKMAKIASIEYKDASDMMTAALRGFNMEINAESALRINDVYSELAARTAASTEEIATAMTKTASIANSAGMSFENTSAFLTKIIETTREAPETAGTALKTVIGRFAEVKELFSKGQLTGEDSEGEIIDVNNIDTALKTVGISLNEFLLGNEGLDSVFLRLAEKWDTIDNATLRYIATMAAGSRLLSRFIAMIDDYERTLELTTMAEESEGSANEQFAKTLDSLDAKLNLLTNSWNEFTMGVANDSMVKTGVDMLTDLLNIFNKVTESAGSAFGTFSKIGGAAGLFGGISSLINRTRTLRGYIADTSNIDILRQLNVTHNLGLTDADIDSYTDAEAQSRILGFVDNQYIPEVNFDSVNLARNTAATNRYTAVRNAMYGNSRRGTIAGLATTGVFTAAGAGFGIAAKNLKESGSATEELIQLFENLSSTATTTAGAIGTVTTVLRSMNASSGVMIAITAVIAAIGLIKGIVDTINDSYTSIEEKLQQWADLASLTASATDAISSAYDKLTLSAENYYNLQLKLDAAQPGTLEYYKALYEYQEAYNEALKGGYIDPITGRYDADALKEQLELITELLETLQIGSAVSTYTNGTIKLHSISFTGYLDLGLDLSTFLLTEKEQDTIAEGITNFFAGANTYTNEDLRYLKTAASYIAKSSGTWDISDSTFRALISEDFLEEYGYNYSGDENKILSNLKHDKNATKNVAEGIKDLDISLLLAIIEEIAGSGVSNTSEYKKALTKQLKTLGSSIFNTESASFNSAALETLLTDEKINAFGTELINKLEGTEDSYLFLSEYSDDIYNSIRQAMLSTLTGLNEEYFSDYDTDELIGLLNANLSKLAVQYENFDFLSWLAAYLNDSIDLYVNDLTLSEEGQRAEDYENFTYSLKDFINNLESKNGKEIDAFYQANKNDTNISPYLESFINQWTNSWKSATLDIQDNLKGIIDVSKISWIYDSSVMQGNFSIEQLTLAGELIQTYGTNFGTFMAESMNTLIQDLLTTPDLFDDFYLALGGVVSSNSITFVKTINEAIAKEALTGPLTDAYTALLRDFKLGDYNSELTKDLINSDSFSDTLESLNEIIDTEGEIDGSNILEVADDCELLADYLDLDVISASALAAILTSIHADDLSVEQFSDDLLAAYNIANAINDLEVTARKNIEEWKESAPESSAYYEDVLKEAAAGVLTEIDEGRYGSDTLDYYLKLFGLDLNYRQFAISNGGLAGYDNLIKNKYGDIEELFGYIAEGNTDMVWSNLDKILPLALFENISGSLWLSELKDIIDFTSTGFSIKKGVTLKDLEDTFAKGGDLGSMLLGLLYESSPNLKYLSESTSAIESAKRLNESNFVTKEQVDALVNSYEDKVTDLDRNEFNAEVSLLRLKQWDKELHNIEALNLMGVADPLGDISTLLGIDYEEVKSRFAGILNSDGTLNVDVFKEGLAGLSYTSSEISSVMSDLEALGITFLTLETTNITNAIDGQTSAICAAISALGIIFSEGAKNMPEAYSKMQLNAISYLNNEGKNATYAEAELHLRDMGVIEGTLAWNDDINKRMNYLRAVSSGKSNVEKTDKEIEDIGKLQEELRKQYGIYSSEHYRKDARSGTAQDITYFEKNNPTVDKDKANQIANSIREGTVRNVSLASEDLENFFLENYADAGYGTANAYKEAFLKERLKYGDAFIKSKFTQSGFTLADFEKYDLLLLQLEYEELRILLAEQERYEILEQRKKDLEEVKSINGQEVTDSTKADLTDNLYVSLLTTKKDEYGVERYFLSENIDKAVEAINNNTDAVDANNNSDADKMVGTTVRLGFEAVGRSDLNTYLKDAIDTDDKDKENSPEVSANVLYGSLKEQYETLDEIKEDYTNIAELTSAALSKVASSYETVISASDSLVSAQEKLAESTKNTAEYYSNLWDTIDATKKARLMGTTDALGFLNELNTIDYAISLREIAQSAEVGKLMAAAANKAMQNNISTSTLSDLGAETVLSKKEESEQDKITTEVLSIVRQAKTIDELKLYIAENSKSSEAKDQTLTLIFEAGNLESLFSQAKLSELPTTYLTKKDAAGLVNTGNATWDSIMSTRAGKESGNLLIAAEEATKVFKELANDETYGALFNSEISALDDQRRAILKNLGIDTDTSEFTSELLIGLILDTLYEAVASYLGLDISLIFKDATVGAVDYKTGNLLTEFGKIQESYNDLNDVQEDLIDSIKDVTYSDLSHGFYTSDYKTDVQDTYAKAYGQALETANLSLTGKIQGGAANWMGLEGIWLGLSLADIEAATEEIVFISDTFGFEAATSFSENLGIMAKEGTLSDFTKDWAENIDTTNIITAYRSIQKASKDTNNEFLQLYAETFSTMQNYSAGDMISALMSSDDFASTYESLADMAEEMGKIDGSAILDAADSSATLNDLLESGIMSALTLADVLAGIALNNIDTTDLTKGLIEAYNIANLVRDYIDESLDNLSDWLDNRPESTGAFEENFVTTATNLTEAVEKGWWGDDAFIYDFGLFGASEEWRDWVADLPNDMSQKDFEAKFKKDWGPFFDIMTSMVEDGDAWAIWENLDTLGKYNTRDEYGNEVNMGNIKEQLTSETGFSIGKDGTVHFDDNTDFTKVRDIFAQLGEYGESLFNWFLNASPDAKLKFTDLSKKEGLAKLFGTSWSGAEGFTGSIFDDNGKLKNFITQKEYDEYMANARKTMSSDEYKELEAKGKEYLAQMDAKGYSLFLAPATSSLSLAILKNGMGLLSGLLKALFGNYENSLELFLNYFGKNFSYFDENGNLKYNINALERGLSALGYSADDIETFKTNLKAAGYELSNFEYDREDEKFSEVTSAINSAADKICAAIKGEETPGSTNTSNSNNENNNPNNNTNNTNNNNENNNTNNNVNSTGLSNGTTANGNGTTKNTNDTISTPTGNVVNLGWETVGRPDLNTPEVGTSANLGFETVGKPELNTSNTMYSGDMAVPSGNVVNLGWETVGRPDLNTPEVGTSANLGFETVGKPELNTFNAAAQGLIVNLGFETVGKPELNTNKEDKENKTVDKKLEEAVETLKEEAENFGDNADNLGDAVENGEDAFAATEDSAQLVAENSELTTQNTLEGLESLVETGTNANEALLESASQLSNSASVIETEATKVGSTSTTITSNAERVGNTSTDITNASTKLTEAGGKLTTAAGVLEAAGLHLQSLTLGLPPARHGKIGALSFRIPGYAKGRSIPRLGHINTNPPRDYEGVALVGEEGPELIVGPNGTYLAGVHGLTFTYLNRDDSVYTAQETRKILGDNGNKIPGFAKGTGDRVDIPGYMSAFHGIKTSSGSSSSSSDDKDDQPYENKLDKLLNLIEHIDKTTRNIEDIEDNRSTWEFELEHTTNSDEYNDIWSKYIESFSDTLELTTLLIKNYNTRIEGRKLELEELMYDKQRYSKYAYYDSELDEIVYDWALLDTVKDSDYGEEIDDYIDELEKYVEDLHDSEDLIADLEASLQKAQESMEKIIDENLKQYREQIDGIREAIISFRLEEIDKLSDLYNVLNENNSDILENMQKVIDELRKLRDLLDNKDDLEEKQRRLALLKRDSSGANAVEIKKLEEEIEDDQESYVDSLVDYSLELLQDANDVAAELRQLLIDLLLEILDYLKEIGYFNDEAEDIFSSLYDEDGNIDWDSAYVKLMQYADDYDAMTEAELEEWRTTFAENNVKAQAGAESYTSTYDTALWSLYKDLRDNQGATDVDILDVLLYYWSKDDINAEDLEDPEKAKILLESYIDGWNYTMSEINDELNSGDIKTELDEAKAKLTAAEEAVKANNTAANRLAYESALGVYNTKNNRYEEATNYRDMYAEFIKEALEKLKTDYGIDYTPDLDEYSDYVKSQSKSKKKKSSSSSSSSSSSGSSKINSLKKAKDDATYTSISKDDSGNYNVTITKKDGSKSSGNYSSYEMKKAGLGAYTYATGGLADYTGPAWLDGTASKPELVLNPDDTKNFLTVVDTLRDLDTNSLGSGTTYFDIHIDVDKLTSDYDVEQVANKIKTMITSDATYRNNNVLNFIR